MTCTSCKQKILDFSKEFGLSLKKKHPKINDKLSKQAKINKLSKTGT